MDEQAEPESNEAMELAAKMSSDSNEPVPGADMESDAQADTDPAKGESVVSFSKIHKLKVNVQAVLGAVPLTVSQLSNLNKGDVIELGTKIGDPIAVLANGDLIARAEIVVTQDEPPGFGLTLTEIVETAGGSD
ncbi:MAG: FliM/FliN family flagellar motor switch protein [Pseudomonadota bacterium]